MTLPKVLFVSFAPKHSSALNRISDCADSSIELEIYQSASDKVTESIADRIFSLKFPKLMVALLRSDARLFWAWGLDACLVVTLAAMLRPGKRLIWDISDLNPRILKSGWRARILRAIEWTFLKRADLLLLTSEAFYDNYYANHINRNDVKVIENLLPGKPSGTLPAPRSDGPFVIVYSGIFRSLKVLKVLREVADRMQGATIFYLHGYPDRTIPKAEFEATISGSPWIHFRGSFKPNELPDIYAQAHLSWAFVDPDANDNEKWLLNNRIYNAVAFSRPALANSGTFLGDVVEARCLGATCELMPNKIAALLHDLIANDYKRYSALRLALPSPESAYLSGHYKQVVHELLATKKV